MGTVEIAPGVAHVSLGFVNVYLIGGPGGTGGPWAVVDAGMAGRFEAIRDAAETRFGPNARPEAIFLTHGHPDHAGSALALATYWDVPVYAHPWEVPYLTGEADYPPGDPTVGGFIGNVSRFFPSEAPDLSGHILPLPGGGVVPGFPAWEWRWVPGHAPGQVAFLREEGKVALVGDALATMDLDKVGRTLAKNPRLSRPPAPFTYDWLAVRKSVRMLAEWGPLILGAGHGVPLTGNTLGDDLTAFAEDFIIPLRGRYVADPVRFDENGVTYLPPVVRDPLPKVVAGVGAAAALLGAAWYLAAQRGKKRKQDGRESDDSV